MVAKINSNKKISECPNCGYEDGFHVSFSAPDNSHESEVILICPNCHEHFQIGWKVHLTK